MALTPVEIAQTKTAAHVMREFRRSEAWDIFSQALTNARDRIHADMAAPRDFGLEATARTRGELRAITWMLNLPEEIITHASGGTS